MSPALASVSAGRSGPTVWCSRSRGRVCHAAAIPGAYLRVIAPGTVRAGDSIVVVDQPDHDVTIGLVFRAVTLEPALLPRILEADALPYPMRQQALRRIG